jgi:signal transduction histidine kinase
MKNWFHQLKVSQKLMLISVFFLMPDSFMLYMFITGINANIEVARLEMKGNEYQRPLEDLLQRIPQHRLDVIAASAAHPDAPALGPPSQALRETEQQIDAGFDALAAVDARIGADLQFTDAGLAKRNRERCSAPLVRREWEELKTALPTLSLAESERRHLQLAADIRTMITHAGDMSNLILDADLDSYYLVDVTLLALPQTQDRLADVMVTGSGRLPGGVALPDIDKADSGDISARFLKESDLDRVVASTATALNENRNNAFRVSATLQPNIAPALAEYVASNEALIALTRQTGAHDRPPTLTAAQYLAAGERARQASFTLWRAADAELDTLFLNRIDGFKSHRTRALTVAAFAFLAAVGFVTFITRSISQPLQLQAWELRQANDALGTEISRRSLAEAAIRQANEHLEERVQQRTHELQELIEEKERNQAKLAEAQTQLLEASRQAGKAEVATGVLHNVGNVLNSVNVSATLLSDKLKASELPTLRKLTALVEAHAADLGAFLTTDPRGATIPSFLSKLSTCLEAERAVLEEETSRLLTGVEHIKQVISAQQFLARGSVVLAPANPTTVFETALMMQQGSFDRHDIEVTRDFEDAPPANIDVHKILQILINLISNARHAVLSQDAGSRRIALSLRTIVGPTGPALRFQVTDSGVGIAPENLARVFSHGFTTKADGHGFGLHSAANAAREMGGSLVVSSDGIGRGATFALDVPLAPSTEARKCA